MSYTKTRAVFHLLMAGTSMMIGAMSAAAQTDPAAPAPQQSDNQIGDIVVTAQRRAESLQRTSVVLDVISSEKLAGSGITQASGLTSVLPGVQIGTVGPATQVYIRGVGDFGSTAVSNPSVAFNIDGVYIGRSQSIASEFYDVDRVEVLKGPQGTLYGRNASGGAVNILTRKPKLGEWSGRFQGEIGNYDSYSGEAALNIPLGDQAALRISGQIADKGGFTSQGYGDDKHQSARAKLLVEPNDDFSILLNASYGHVGGKGGAFVLVNRIPGLANQSPWLDGTDPVARAYIISQTFAGLPPIPGIVDPPRAADGFNDINVWNVSAEMNLKLGFATLTVVPAYRDASLRYSAVNLLNYNVGAPFGPFPEKPETSRQSSLEVRLSNESPNFKWVLGGYYYDEDQKAQYTVRSGLIQYSGVRYGFRTRSYSAFGQATYSVTPAIRLIAGARYTSDQRQLNNGQNYFVAPTVSGGPPGGVGPCFAVAPGTICPSERYSGDRTFSNVSWKGGIEADIGEQSLFYATASSGFKAGGFNEQIAPTAAPTSNQAYGYRPEKLIAYEVGLKNRFFDNRLQVNVEAFYWDYRDHQEPRLSFSGAGNIGLTFDNAGKARMYGGSVDVIARPWRGGTFSGSVEYNNSKYVEFSILTPASLLIPGTNACPVLPTTLTPGAFGPIVQLDCSGNQVTRAPKWTGRVGFNQTVPLGNDGTISFDTDLLFASSRWLAPEFIPTERAPSYQTWNASIGYSAPENRYTITAFVRNITNDNAYTGGLANAFTPGVVVANIGPPRTYGVRLGFNF